MAPKPKPAIERFNAKIRRTANGCHEWMAYRGENGYGRFYVDGRGALAHRWAYEYFIGPIPPGLQIDHLCKNRSCVNPEHLEAVTGSVNVRRSSNAEAARRRAKATTHCPRGHEYTPENTYQTSGGRACRICKRELGRAHYLANKEEYIARAARWRKNNIERAREMSREGQRRYRSRQNSG